jgi:predicted branched-subunit amino acid permease
MASSLKGGPLRRALEGQATVDSSWATGSRGDGTFDRGLVFGMTAPQYVGWVLGTVVGAYSGGLLADPEALGLDALFPTFFVGILIADLRRPRARLAAALGGAVALALVPFTPPGVPVLAASVGALVGLAQPDARRVTEGALTLMGLLVKGIGPALVGGRALPRWASGVIALMAPALLTALVLTAVLTDGRRLTAGADTVGVAVAAVLLLRRAPLLVACLAAVAVTAGLRLLAG